MNKEFVPYEESLELKGLGFDEPCFSYYELDGRLSDTPKESGDDIKYQGDCKFDNHQNQYLDEDESCSSPTFSQAFRWFREKYELDSFVNAEWKQMVKVGYYFNAGDYYSPQPNHLTYEEAELACLRKLIEIVKNK